MKIKKLVNKRKIMNLTNVKYTNKSLISKKRIMNYSN